VQAPSEAAATAAVMAAINPRLIMVRFSWASSYSRGAPERRLNA
jgi:hypothetical protein